MQRVPFLALTFVLLASCERVSEPSQPSTAEPADVFRLQYELLRAGDADGLWDLFSDAVKRDCEGLRDNLDGSVLDEELAERLAQLSPAKACAMPFIKDRRQVYSTPQIRNVERPSPDTAIVHFGRDGSYGQRFVRVGKKWKIDEYLSVQWMVPMSEEFRHMKVRLPDGK